MHAAALVADNGTFWKRLQRGVCCEVLDRSRPEVAEEADAALQISTAQRLAAAELSLLHQRRYKGAAAPKGKTGKKPTHRRC